MILILYSLPAFLTLQGSNDYIFEHTCCRDFDWDKVRNFILVFISCLSDDLYQIQTRHLAPAADQEKEVSFLYKESRED
jgi:hypothetical protein